jgi:hypothetical protein
LDFLSQELCAEILASPDQMSSGPSSAHLISGRTFRVKAEATSLEVARDVFIIGSLTGDSLIRHAIGGCVFAAGRILGAIPTIYSPDSTPSPTSSTPRSASPVSTSDTEIAAEDMQASPRKEKSGRRTPGELTNGHADLHLDRRKLVRSVETANAENRYWVDSGWWAGGLGPGRS